MGEVPFPARREVVVERDRSRARAPSRRSQKWLPMKPAPPTMTTLGRVAALILVDSHLVAGLLQGRVAHQEVPDHRAEPLGVGRDPIGRDGRDDDAGLGGRAASRRRPCRRCRTRRAPRSRASSSARTRLGETFFSRLPPPTENTSSASSRAEPRDLEPLGEAGLPALVVHARGQLGHVVGRRVRLEAADLAEVVDRVAGVPGRAADAQDEQPPAAVAHAREPGREGVDRGCVEPAHRGQRLIQVRPDELGGAHSLNPAACASR